MLILISPNTTQLAAPQIAKRFAESQIAESRTNCGVELAWGCYNLHSVARTGEFHHTADQASLILSIFNTGKLGVNCSGLAVAIG